MRLGIYGFYVFKKSSRLQMQIAIYTFHFEKYKCFIAKNAKKVDDNYDVHSNNIVQTIKALVKLNRDP